MDSKKHTRADTRVTTTRTCKRIPGTRAPVWDHHIIHVRIPAADADLPEIIRRAAERSGTSMSDWIRTILRKAAAAAQQMVT